MRLSSGHFGSSTTCATVTVQKHLISAVFSCSESGVCSSFVCKGPSSKSSPSPSGKHVLTFQPSSLSVLTPTGVFSSIETKLTEIDSVSWSESEHSVVFTALTAESTNEYDLNHFDWRGEGRGEGFSPRFPSLFVWSLLSDKAPKMIDLRRMDEPHFVSHPCFLGDKVFCLVQIVSKTAPAGRVFCTNRPGFVAEVTPDGHLRELPNTRGVGLRNLAVCGSLLFWLAASSTLMHASSSSIFGVEPFVGTRPLAYVSGLDDCKFQVGSTSSVFFTFLRRCVVVLARLDVESGAVTEMVNQGATSCHLLDARNDHALVGLNSQAEGISIVVVAGSKLAQTAVLASPLIEARKGVRLSVVRCAENEDVDSILVQPENATKLCLFLHGGPHSAFSTEWNVIVDALLKENIAVLMPGLILSFFSLPLSQWNFERIRWLVGAAESAEAAWKNW
jgi:hypothetical protein